MWSFDINKRNWSPILAESSTLPPPRSDFAHARFQDNLVIFGGKGESELLSDLYRYNINTREWKLLTTESYPKPTARRASCMSVADDFI